MKLCMERKNDFRKWAVKHIDVLIVLAIIIVSSIALFPNLDKAPMWAGDDYNYFQWAKHMVETGDYLTPWAFGGTCLWLSKPPLVIWLMSLAIQVFGPNNFAARFWSSVFGLLCSVVVFYLGKLLFNRLVGAVSAVILLTFSVFFAYSRLGYLDVPLTFFASSSIYFFILNEKSDRKTYVLLSGILFGLALMTKQLAALFIPVIIISYLVIVNKNVRCLFIKQVALFVGIGLLIFSPWVIYMFLRFGSDFWQEYFYLQVFQRATVTTGYNTGNYLFYFNYLISNENKFWLFLLPFAITLSIMHLFSNRKRGDVLLLVWLTVILGIFSLSQTRYGWYIIPIFPAFAILLGNFLYQMFKKIRYWGFLPILVLIAFLIVLPSVSTHTELVLSAETHWDSATVTSIASLPTVNGCTTIVVGGNLDTKESQVAYLSTWNFSGQTFERTAYNQLSPGISINCLAVGDVNEDNKTEIVSIGNFFNGTTETSQLIVWDSDSLVLENKTEWCWADYTCGNSLAIGDVDADGHDEIITGGCFYNGTCEIALLIVWDGQSLSPKNFTYWAESGNTTINSVALDDVDGDGLTEVIAGGYRVEGEREISHLSVWNSSLYLKTDTTSINYGITGLWEGNVRVNSVATGDVNADGLHEIVTGGYCYENASEKAEITVWKGENLSLAMASTIYDWGLGSVVNSLTLSDVDKDGLAESITGGTFSNGTHSFAQIIVWNGATLTYKATANWCWLQGCKINSVVAVNINSNPTQIIVGGSFINGTIENAQLVAFEIETK